MQLYFVRHGESDANLQHVISNRESPFHLSQQGREQAGRLAEELKGIPFTAIYASPVLRARETAEILAEALGQPVQVTEALREYDCGVLEERSDEEAWRLHREIADDWTLRGNYTRKPEGGENFLEIRRRFLPFVESLAGGDGAVLLVSHGGLLQLMLPELLANVDPSFVRSHGIGHLQPIRVEPGPEGFICRRWGAVVF